ncbi:hypothetical protein AeNC1_011697, partial [Aphanomyces euteiches]
MATNASALNATAAVVANFTKFNGTTFKSCAFYDGLVSTTFHLHPNAIRSNDCKSSTCSALFAALVQQLGNCSIEDDDSHTIVAVSSFGGICQASTPTTAPSNIIIYSPSATVEPYNHSSSTTTIVAIACASVVALALILFAWSRKRRLVNDCDATEKMSMQAQLSDLDMFRIPSAELMLTRPLAEGAYGQVWFGEYNHSAVAIKRLLPNKSNANELLKFMAELVLLSKMDCPYVVAFYGVAWTRPTDILMVTEFVEHGDLRHVLESTALTWPLKLQCALHIAEALVYLFCMEPRVIHRDLKLRNVLLNDEYHAKVTDFGIAREMDDTTMTSGIGTYRWMAPEVLQDGHYTQAADIFSFGVILAELETEMLPYSDLRNGRGNQLTDTAIMAKVMAGELTPRSPPIALN